MLHSAVIFLLSPGTVVGQPADCPCITWKQGDCKTKPNMDEYIDSEYGAWIWKGGTAGCAPCDPTKGGDTCGYILPCFAPAPANTFGHHCVTPAKYTMNAPCNAALAQGGDSQPCTQFWPAKGPKAELFGWGLTQAGSSPNPSLGQLISYTQPTGLTYVMARSTQAAPYPNCGPGDTGWVELYANNTFGAMRYTDGPLVTVVSGSFEVAYCNHCHKCPLQKNETQPEGCPPCAPPPPPPAPPAPPGGEPCIRFGHTIATTEQVDVTITQGSISYTWSNYKFSQFSDWVIKFKNGNGQIDVKSGGKTILSATKLLTPGPLVVVIKDGWPPKDPDQIETIAASFVPGKNGSKVRLVNLAKDVEFADLHSGSASGPTLASKVQYTLGSKPWTNIPAGSGTFVATSGSTSLASATFTAPGAPNAFTTFLLGTKDFGYSLVPEIDAPEYGPCRPNLLKEPAEYV